MTTTMTMTRFISRAAIALALMLLTTATAWAWTGSGTSDAPYQIANKSDLEDCAAYIQQDFNKTEQQYQQGRRHKPADDGSDATPVEPEA